MNNQSIILSGIHLELTPALRALVEEKMQKLFAHEERITRIRVELEYDASRTHLTEFVASGHIDSYGTEIVAKAQSEDLYKSIDELVRMLDQQLRRRASLNKSKRKSVHPIE